MVFKKVIRNENVVLVVMEREFFFVIKILEIVFVCYLLNVFFLIGVN